MSISGEEGDTRQFRSERKSDFSESKTAFQQKQHKTPICSICKQKIIGVSFDLGDGGFACFRCHNEPL